MAKETANQTVSENASAKEQVINLFKIEDASIKAAIAAASSELKGDSYDDPDAALKAAGEANDNFFNPSLSQYKVGMILDTHKDNVRVRRVNVGRGSSKAWVITCPAGVRDASVEGGIRWTGAFNMYPSTLRKTIQVTDENGDAVLDEHKQPVVLGNEGNPVWEAARACSNGKELLEYALDKRFEVADITRDFGPSVFVEMADKSRKATAHKLTSLPKFNLI
jgi:hypothetical protein